MRTSLVRRGACLAAVLCACDALTGAGGGGGGGDTPPPPDPKYADAQTLLTRSLFQPSPDDPVAWVGGFSADDLWLGAAGGGVLRSRGRAKPEPVDELASAKVGGAVSEPDFLPSGELFFKVYEYAGGIRFYRWNDGAVEDLTEDLVADPARWLELVHSVGRTPGGDEVALVGDGTGTRLDVLVWSAGGFRKTASLPVDPLMATNRVYPLSATEFLAVIASPNGSYRLETWDGSAFRAALSPAPLLDAPFWATSSRSGFFAVSRLYYWDGKRLRDAPSPASSPVYVPFAPDGLASVASDGSKAKYANPLLHVQRGTAKAVVHRAGVRGARWMATGIAGDRLLTVVDGGGADDPSVVAVELAPVAAQTATGPGTR